MGCPVIWLQLVGAEQGPATPRHRVCAVDPSAGGSSDSGDSCGVSSAPGWVVRDVCHSMCFYVAHPCAVYVCIWLYVSFELFIKYAFPCVKGMLGHFFLKKNRSCDPVGTPIWEINSITFCLVICNCSNPVEFYGECKDSLFHWPQKGTISLFTWWEGIFEPVFKKFLNL